MDEDRDRPRLVRQGGRGDDRRAAGRSGGSPADAERAANIKKGASILIEETADHVIKDAAKHGVTLSKEQARTMVRKADPWLAAAEMGAN